MSTDRETVKTLCKSIVNRLENRKSIEFQPRIRQDVVDDVYDRVAPAIYTDQDLREKALAAIGENASALDDTAFTESERFRAAKQVIRRSFGDDVLHGLYFQKSLKQIAETLSDYFMNDKKIEEVYVDDLELEKAVVETIQKFNPKNLI